LTERRRIVLGEADFDDVAVPAAPAPPPPPAQPGVAAPGGLPPVARRPPLSVDTAAAPYAPPANLLNDPRAAGVIAATIGMALGWGVTEVFGIHEIEVQSQAGAHAVTALWTGVVGVVFAGVLVSFDRAVSGAWAAAGQRALRAAVPAFAVGAAAGFVANVVYMEIVEGLIEDVLRSGDLSFSEHDVRFYLARALGWAIFGAGAGAAIGLVERSPAKAVNGAIGGGLGGAAGGIAFHFMSAATDSVGLSRLLGLVAIGVLIAVATRVVEAARRDAWLRIVAGGMAGKEFILYHAVTRIGSIPENEIYLLKDSAVAPLHAQIEERGGRRVLTAAPGAAVLVNGSQVVSHQLRDGDHVQIGGTVIGYTERAAAPLGPA
jgi:Inner membrane component of T3SS, cytoplasmic domain